MESTINIWQDHSNFQDKSAVTVQKPEADTTTTVRELFQSGRKPTETNSELVKTLYRSIMLKAYEATTVAIKTLASYSDLASTKKEQANSELNLTLNNLFEPFGLQFAKEDIATIATTILTTCKATNLDNDKPVKHYAVLGEVAFENRFRQLIAIAMSKRQVVANELYEVYRNNNSLRNLRSKENKLKRQSHELRELLLQETAPVTREYLSNQLTAKQQTLDGVLLRITELEQELKVEHQKTAGKRQGEDSSDPKHNGQSVPLPQVEYTYAIVRDKDGKAVGTTEAIMLPTNNYLQLTAQHTTSYHK